MQITARNPALYNVPCSHVLSRSCSLYLIMQCNFCIVYTFLSVTEDHIWNIFVGPEGS